MNEKLSLLKYCIPCEATCCKISNLIGSPILSKDEASEIEKISQNSTSEIISPTGQKYYILKERDNGKCPLLTKRNRCRAQKIKPLDCLCYPIKAVYDEDSARKFIFILDSDCPASKSLTEDFIYHAKITAVSSIIRFDMQTYNYWLENNVGWIKKGIKID